MTAPACGRLLHRPSDAATATATASTTASASDADDDADEAGCRTESAPTKKAGHGKSASWCQLSGHADCFSRAGPGTIWKKCSGGTERNVYEALSEEPHLRDIVPRFLREVEYNGEKYIELQDLLHSFRDPYVMDVKMGTRTFLESEVQNTFAREDLYLKVRPELTRPLPSPSLPPPVMCDSRLSPLSFHLVSDDRRRSERADAPRERFQKSDQAAIYAVSRATEFYQHLGLPNRSDESEFRTGSSLRPSVPRYASPNRVTTISPFGSPVAANRLIAILLRTTRSLLKFFDLPAYEYILVRTTTRHREWPNY